ncbi:MAG TPA: FGGY family carbohydrate kinase [Atribacteraceae bacterium]|nr:FGGY family carbohydrate kinase [Atribacteraceae bacterium]
MDRYFLTIDLGTTSVKLMVWDRTGKTISREVYPVELAYPKPGWVECDPEAIAWSVQEALGKIDVPLEGIGLATQRETTVIWDGGGTPLYPAIVWQDRRTSPWCEAHQKERGFLYSRTGLILDPYFSLSKLVWLLEHVPKGTVPYFGTLDSFLLWKLTGGQSYLTDYTNASRTMVYNIFSLEWDREIIRMFSLEGVNFPRAVSSFHRFGETKTRRGTVPILAMLGDQQSSFLGQGCLKPGDVKNTYGTGSFLLAHCGDTTPCHSEGLIVTLASQVSDRPVFALEASAFSAGALMEWLKNTGLITHAGETDDLARQARTIDDLVIIPAFCGLGAPHWDPYARGAMLGLTPAVGRAEIVRACLEAVALESAALIEQLCLSVPGITEITVDGGMSQNAFLMQFQADVSGKNIRLFPDPEATSLGVFFLMANRLGYLEQEYLLEKRFSGTLYTPKMSESERRRYLAKWQRGIERVRGWSRHDEKL